MTVSHFANEPVMDVYANTQLRDLGGVARDVLKVIRTSPSICRLEHG